MRKAERAARGQAPHGAGQGMGEGSQAPEEAEALAKAAGGSTAWFQGRSAKQREKWSDLETELVNGERLVKEAAEVWQQGQGRLRRVK